MMLRRMWLPLSETQNQRRTGSQKRALLPSETSLSLANTLQVRHKQARCSHIITFGHKHSHAHAVRVPVYLRVRVSLSACEPLCADADIEAQMAGFSAQQKRAVKAIAQVLNE